ncbi:MAG: hypothetical protein VKM17_07125 [Cyanobacteriota bacterium]|nr:hypothetical protein [Cyanobacteriota bacterium]
MLSVLPPKRPPRRSPPRQRLPRGAAPGYVMPLAIGASGLLLLGSFALHGVSMQEHLQVGAVERQQREEDLLASAAHQLLASLNKAHRCLLGKDLVEWDANQQACATPAQLAALKTIQVMVQPELLQAWQTKAVQLLAWQKKERLNQNGEVVAFVELSLQLEAGRQARFEVQPAASLTEDARLGPRLLVELQP